MEAISKEKCSFLKNGVSIAITTIFAFKVASCCRFENNLRYIPYGKGAQFEIQVCNHEDSSGKVYDLLEVKAPLDAYLEGMDSQEVANWRAEQERQEKYAGLKIGDLETPNNNAGNWE